MEEYKSQGCEKEMRGSFSLCTSRNKSKCREQTWHFKIKVDLLRLHQTANMSGSTKCLVWMNWWKCTSEMAVVLKESYVFLAHKHSVVVSIKRLCRKLHLFRRKNHICMKEMAAFVPAEICFVCMGSREEQAPVNVDIMCAFLCKCEERCWEGLVEGFNPGLRRGSGSRVPGPGSMSRGNRGSMILTP